MEEVHDIRRNVHPRQPTPDSIHVKFGVKKNQRDKDLFVVCWGRSIKPAWLISRSARDGELGSFNRASAISSTAIGRRLAQRIERPGLWDGNCNI
jgi:hypothetical protein